MKTLSHPNDAAEIRTRILSLTPNDVPQWGIMTVNQMICHVREAYVYALTDAPVDFIPLPFPPRVVKQFALKLPTPWPHSTTTIPQLKLNAPGMACTNFEQDRDTLLASFDSFSALANHTRDHPFFASMEHADWMRWGYLHADHHLRQFNH
ncbi:MAG TPA: DUF1569 domain-containing protein [Acidobacteriaceae bacterium]